MKTLNRMVIYRFKKALHLTALFCSIRFKNKIKFLGSLFGSHAQLHQDLFALSHFDFKKGGYFVEFGACNGRYLSNTLMLEESFRWSGLLSEPAKSWHDELRINRKAKIDFRCVWKKSGEDITFYEENDPALSGIYNDDNPKDDKLNYTGYQVKSVTLIDLLKENNAPRKIDFLSIDTEGSEFDILSNFDFNEYRVEVICVEHNYSVNRESIFQLLTNNGYKRKFRFLSRFDDWYVLPNEI